MVKKLYLSDKEGEIMYKQIQPNHFLKHIVRYFWILDTSDVSRKVSKHYLIPEVHSYILVSISGSFKITEDSNDQIDTRKPLLVAGLKKPLQVTRSETLIMAGSSLYPGHAKALGFRNLDTSGGIIPIHIPLPGEQEKSTPFHYIDCMQTFIGNRLRKTPDTEAHSMCIKGLNSLNRPGCCFKKACHCCGCSLRQLERFSLEYTGYSPREYIAVRACSEAREKIRQGTYNDLTDLAMDLGFCDQSHFCKTFKKWTGMSPGAYKRYWDQLRGSCEKGAENRYLRQTAYPAAIKTVDYMRSV
jgi:AraC-like DNA-binding protein